MRSDIQECLASCGISAQDYNDLIRALFQAAPKELRAHAVKRYTGRGYPVATTTVKRAFAGVTIVAEDRGSVYVVWVTRTDEEGRTAEMVKFAEFPWGQI